jgi:peptidoglycan/xylan/chitin deacetylase (PgdA/CDA1 family)
MLNIIGSDMPDNKNNNTDRAIVSTLSDFAWYNIEWLIDGIGRRTIKRGFHDLMSIGSQVIKRFEASTKSICLTFDDGPNPDTTTELLSALRRHNVQATLFCVGQHLIRYPSLAKAMLEDGHEIANHTMNHLNLYRVAPRQLLNEVQLCQEAIETTCGVRNKLFRAPYGHFRSDLSRSKHLGIEHFVKWDVTPEWFETSPSRIAENILSFTKDGSIILLHDGLADQEPELSKFVGLAAANSIDLIVPPLKALGFTFKTVSEQVDTVTAVTASDFR